LRFNAIEPGLAKLSWAFWYSWLVVPSPTSAWRLVPFTSSSKERRRLNHHSVDKPTRLRHIRYIIYQYPEIYLILENVLWSPQSPSQTLAPPAFGPRVSARITNFQLAYSPRKIVKGCPETEDFILSREE
jgi:hypothetical protein